jgi:hypothetical protein
LGARRGAGLGIYLALASGAGLAGRSARAQAHDLRLEQAQQAIEPARLCELAGLRMQRASAQFWAYPSGQAYIVGADLRAVGAMTMGKRGVLVDMVGERFGRLTVRGRAANTKTGQTRWLCDCDCGSVKTIVGYNLRNGQHSCGCLRSRRFRNMIHKSNRFGVGQCVDNVGEFLAGDG